MAFKICIDAGHYGHYNANKHVTPTYWESLMAWELHLYQVEEFKRYKDVTVVTTRKTEEADLDLMARGRTAKGCNLFISDHSNWCETPSVDRAVVIYPVNGRCKDLAQNLAETITKTMGLNGKPQIFYKWNSSKNADYYGVIRGAAAVGVPGLILEHSFHSNNTSTKWLQSSANLRKLAKAEVETIARYYGLKLKEEEEVNVTKDELNQMLAAQEKKLTEQYAAKLTAAVKEIQKASDKQLELHKQALNELLLQRLGVEVDHIGDIPHANVRPEVRQLMDCGAINGGTDASVDPDDIHLPYNIVRALVMSKRYTDYVASKSDKE